MYLGDLTVNGRRFDLSQDPHWEGRNNESRYVEPNFHAMHSYGWLQTSGHSVEFSLDDVTYTARREPGTRPRFIPQETVEVPYPHKQAGRGYRTAGGMKS